MQRLVMKVDEEKEEEVHCGHLRLVGALLLLLLPEQVCPYEGLSVEVHVEAQRDESDPHLR